MSLHIGVHTMSLQARIKLIDSSDKIQKKILDASSEELKKMFQKAKHKIHSELINLTVDALSDCPEIMSLKDGRLKYDFGLDFDPSDDIIYAVANSVQVYFKYFKFTKTGATSVMSVYIQPEDFKNLFGLESANVITEKGGSLPWLQWLLTAGDAIVVYDAHVSYGSNYPTSRSGGAIMLDGGIFKVASEFSGTEDNNFITRALIKKQDQIKSIIEKSI